MPTSMVLVPAPGRATTVLVSPTIGAISFARALNLLRVGVQVGFKFNDLSILRDMDLQEFRNLLLSLKQSQSQKASYLLIPLGEKRCGQATMADTAGTS